MRLPRFRLRTLMIAVAVVAMAFGGRDLLHRARERRAEVQRLVAIEMVAQWKLRIATATPEDSGPYSHEDLPRLRQLVDRIKRYREDYERAALYPWLPLPPDPQEPK